MLIRSMGPISELDMEYSMDCYFRQKWKDERLRFRRFATETMKEVSNISLSIKMLDKIWKPDTYFFNGKGSYLHTITQPNKLLRISDNGDVLYSMRLTIKAKCPMKLESFPMDRQSCPLMFGSYAYSEEQIRFEWENVDLVAGMVLSQYDLIATPIYNISHKINNGRHSMLVVYFNLHRHMGYFLIQVYVPCVLLVVLSWVSFWINREATADRVGLGMTTVLTLSTFGSDTRTDLPKVPYPTALDWFVIMCFAFVMLTLLEYAGVHYFTKVGSGEYFPGQEDAGREGERDANYAEEEDTDEDDSVRECPERFVWTEVSSQVDGYPKTFEVPIGPGYRYARSPTQCIPPPPRPARRRVPRCLQFMYCLMGNKRYRDEMRRSAPPGRTVNSVSIIDRCSRILFPLSFIVLNLIYWVGYTRFAKDGWQRGRRL
ncbi:gamma-aminobutyric acid receptor alpha-like [Galendromus occidentalis]|uniref:Gamma-aminobutyric acid receptor alpha-like n=1 Tax=Galendromus occidentalis TaxID=34638 RepID=A0AAJ7SGU7_9ACAR|nr:gamma-aminobutyric acid receptor alpha-like [Galendromus occidentalis]